MHDLVLLVADKNMEYALRGALGRPVSLGIRPIEFDIRRHPQNDGGVRVTGAEILARESRMYGHALMILDHEGSGADDLSASELEKQLDLQLCEHWSGRAKSVVISPELDIWMWGGDNVLTDVLQWQRTERIRDWLKAQGFEFGLNDKPMRPKEALEKLRFEQRLPRSSSIYESIASKISLRKCSDDAFLRMLSVLQSWFASEPASS